MCILFVISTNSLIPKRNEISINQVLPLIDAIISGAHNSRPIYRSMAIIIVISKWITYLPDVSVDFPAKYQKQC